MCYHFIHYLNPQNTPYEKSIIVYRNVIVFVKKHYGSIG